jgi:hypothetical protein
MSATSYRARVGLSPVQRAQVEVEDAFNRCLRDPRPENIAAFCDACQRYQDVLGRWPFTEDAQ